MKWRQESAWTNESSGLDKFINCEHFPFNWKYSLCVERMSARWVIISETGSTIVAVKWKLFLVVVVFISCCSFWCCIQFSTVAWITQCVLVLRVWWYLGEFSVHVQVVEMLCTILVVVILWVAYYRLVRNRQMIYYVRCCTFCMEIVFATT